jgi:regulator of sirC expression with transglutaminase-like and TPR domain
VPLLRARGTGARLPLARGAGAARPRAGKRHPRRKGAALSVAFSDLAATADPSLDELALSIAAEFRPVDEAGTLARLDELGSELAGAVRGRSNARAQAHAVSAVLGDRHGYEGDRKRYDRPENSMIDLVVETRRGLPILLSVVYVEVGRRAGLPLCGVGLPGHFVVGHFGERPPVLMDPFHRGTVLGEQPVKPWRPHEIALRMLNNLVGSYERRGDLARTLRAAEMRLELPVDAAVRDQLETEMRGLRSRLN